MAYIEREYDLGLKWWHILFVAGFFTLAGAYTIACALPYWILLVLSLAGAVLAGALVVDRLFFRRRIAFTPTSLLLSQPGSFFKEEAIDYRAITGLKVSKSERSGLGYLCVTYRGGRRWILEASLPSRAAFEEVCALLTARVRASEQMGLAEPGAPDVTMNVQPPSRE